MIVTWVWLDHPNVLQCFGITMNPLQVVTEWAPKGNIVEYVQTKLVAGRIFLVSPPYLSTQEEYRSTPPPPDAHHLQVI